jgi:hypothetical protein
MHIGRRLVYRYQESVHHFLAGWAHENRDDDRMIRSGAQRLSEKGSGSSRKRHFPVVSIKGEGVMELTPYNRKSRSRLPYVDIRARCRVIKVQDYGVGVSIILLPV